MPKNTNCKGKKKKNQQQQKTNYSLDSSASHSRWGWPVNLLPALGTGFAEPRINKAHNNQS